MRERSWHHTVEVLRPASWLNALFEEMKGTTSLVILWQLLVEQSKCWGYHSRRRGDNTYQDQVHAASASDLAKISWSLWRRASGWLCRYCKHLDQQLVMLHAQVFIFDNIADANQFYRFAHKATTQAIPTRNCVKMCENCENHDPHWLCGNCAVRSVRTLKFLVTRDLSWPSLLPQNTSLQAAIKDTLHKNIGHLTEERTRIRPVLRASHFLLQAAKVCRLSRELFFALRVPFVAEG